MTLSANGSSCNRKEINKLIGENPAQGSHPRPLRIYFSKRGHAKVELALAKGKKQYDRRESIKAREAGREVERRSRAGNSLSHLRY